MSKQRGFTLIELLIVVAIIAILAAIAVPNFLEAQIRSKVTRVKSEFRTIATAVEAYAVDHNKYPRSVHTVLYPGDAAYYPGAGLVRNVLWWGLSTPIAYISRVDYLDPFMTTDVALNIEDRLYTYQNLLVMSERVGGAYWDGCLEFFGPWRLASVGPDKTFIAPFPAPTFNLIYDATNGTVSDGNIQRSHTYSDCQQPPTGTLLNSH
jgi:prepilin-type N-terminal cleavage/methylation domain-containing protein